MVEEVSRQQEAAGGEDEEADVNLLGMEEKKKTHVRVLSMTFMSPMKGSVPSKGLQPGVPPSGQRAAAAGGQRLR